jgi:hypothetical protein
MEACMALTWDRWRGCLPGCPRWPRSTPLHLLLAQPGASVDSCTMLIAASSASAEICLAVMGAVNADGRNPLQVSLFFLVFPFR